MAAGQPRIVAVMVPRLRALLDKARAIKQETTVEPILPTGELEQDIKHLSDFDSPITQQTRDEAAESAARTVLYGLVASTSINDPEFVQVWNLLDIVQAAADLGQAHVVLFMLLIEELLDTQTLDGCRRVFDYLESRREKIVAAVFAKNKLILLRTCNELLRRLSKAEDAVFAGRIYIFLFQSYPLGDKSSVNLRGEFHTENVTTFEDISAIRYGDGQDAAGEMDVDGEKKEAVAAPVEENGPKDQDGDAQMDDATRATPGITTTDTSGKTSVKREEKVDDVDPMTLYPIFWSLQHAFSNPPSLFDDNALADFKNGLELTIKKFKTIRQPTPKSINGRSGLAKDASGSRKRKRSDDMVDTAEPTTQASAAGNASEIFNPKYLTTASLFELELADLTFHRHICVQALILLDFLLSLTPKAKAYMAQFKPQRAVAYAYTLSPENETWANGMRRQIESYLLRHPDGASYSRMVEHVLARDKGWVRWKAQNCPPIERPPLATECVVEARRGAKARSTWKRLKAQPMGALNLSFLTTTLTTQAGEYLPGVRKTASDVESARPKPDALITATQGIDMDIDLETPRGQDLAKRKDELEAKEKEAKRPLRDEREKLRAENQAYLRERAGYESQRATRTWRLLRMTSRSKFNLLREIDEHKDVTLCSPEKQAEREAREKEAAAGKSAEQTAEDEAKESADVPVGKEEGEEEGKADVEMEGDGDSKGEGGGEGEGGKAVVGEEDGEGKGEAAPEENGAAAGEEE